MVLMIMVSGYICNAQSTHIHIKRCVHIVYKLFGGLNRADAQGG